MLSRCVTCTVAPQSATRADQSSQIVRLHDLVLSVPVNPGGWPKACSSSWKEDCQSEPDGARLELESLAGVGVATGRDH